jgi:hypothetical protein
MDRLRSGEAGGACLGALVKIRNLVGRNVSRKCYFGDASGLLYGEA